LFIIIVVVAAAVFFGDGGGGGGIAALLLRTHSYRCICFCFFCFVCLFLHKDYLLTAGIRWTVVFLPLSGKERLRLQQATV